MMLDTRKQPFMTTRKHDLTLRLLFSRETGIVGSLASAEKDLCRDDDVTTTELKFFDDATPVSWPRNHQRIAASEERNEGTYNSNSAPPLP